MENRRCLESKQTVHAHLSFCLVRPAVILLVKVSHMTNQTSKGPETEAPPLGRRAYLPCKLHGKGAMHNLFF